MALGAGKQLRQVKTSLEQEFNRYDAVIYFETAAAGGIAIEGGNPIRIENIEEALALDCPAVKRPKKMNGSVPTLLLARLLDN